MNTDEVKAELRRVALHGVRPWWDLKGGSFWHAANYCGRGEAMSDMPDKTIRTFFLLVAEAM